MESEDVEVRGLGIYEHLATTTDTAPLSKAVCAAPTRTAVLDGAGALELRGSFGVHGARRSSNWTGAPSGAEWQAIADTTRRGYTGHEMLDNVLLVHMNGRVYEPRTGRFVSADPHVDGAATTQGWNRYAYVHGRVLSARDPSGFAATSSGTVIVEATRLTPFDRDYVLPRLSELLRLRPPTTGLPLDGEGLERIEVRARRQAEAEDRQEPIAPVVVTVQGNLPPCSSIKGAWFDLESQIGAYGSLGTRLTLFGLPARGHAEVNLFSYNTPASGQAYWSRGVEGSIQIGRLRVGVAWEQRSFDGGFSFHSEPTNFMVGDLRGSIAGADYEVSMGAGVGFTASVDNLGALLPAADTPLCHP